MSDAPPKAYRSVLNVPATNQRALAKIASLACDAVILDLEDAVAPGDKIAARDNLKSWFGQQPAAKAEIIIRINPMFATNTAVISLARDVYWHAVWSNIMSDSSRLASADGTCTPTSIRTISCRAWQAPLIVRHPC